MIMTKEGLEIARGTLKEMHEKSAKALELLEFLDIVAIGTEGNSIVGNTIVGKIIGMKDNDLLIAVIAAREIDHKMRNLTNKGIKRRTYPLPLWRITACKEVKLEEVPLYVNFKYLSPQFKNTYLR